ncbi:MAG: hypothetical protein JXR96_03540 [Deltaproteobacteria bacterium]|nr:hypothetical protein [Deltaproteobacteria bacterium]
MRLPAMAGLALTGLMLCTVHCGSEGSQDPSDCSPMTATPVSGEAFTGSDACAGVAENGVYRYPGGQNDLNDAYCETLEACSAGACPAAPGSPAGSMLVYVFGTATGCSAAASIEEVRDCGNRIEVDYRVEGSGACATTLNAWASVWVEDSDLTVQFNPLP